MLGLKDAFRGCTSIEESSTVMQMSTGEGKAKVLDEKETTVYKRALDQEYKLKLKASRQIFSEINKKYPTMPFTVRSLDTKQGRLGLVECLNHGLLHPYPVLHEKVCPHVAHLISALCCTRRCLCISLAGSGAATARTDLSCTPWSMLHKNVGLRDIMLRFPRCRSMGGALLQACKADVHRAVHSTLSAWPSQRELQWKISGRAIFEIRCLSHCRMESW